MSEQRPLGAMLCVIAHASIDDGARAGSPAPAPRFEDPRLAAHRACFVTLHLEEALRGCIGSLAAQRPLAEDVHHNAFAAGFRDPRFSPLTLEEARRVRVSISVLGEMRPLDFADEPALLAALVPGEDGLLLRAGDRQATFLPSVWRQIPDPAEFVRALKRKAGWAPEFDAYEALRYRCEHYHGLAPGRG